MCGRHYILNFTHSPSPCMSSMHNNLPHLQGVFHVQGAQGHSGRPVCSPTFAVCYRITSLATLLLNGLHLHPTPTATDPQLHSSAAAGHECLCACTSCLCLSVCLGNPVLLAASPHHHRQDRFSLSSFRYIKRG